MSPGSENALQALRPILNGLLQKKKTIELVATPDEVAKRFLL